MDTSADTNKRSSESEEQKDAKRPKHDMSEAKSGEAVVTVGELDGLKFISKGKVREIFEVDDDTLAFVASDRISAFDVVMTNGIPGKGKVLTQLTEFWLKTLFADKEKFGENHLITANIDEMPESVKKHREILEGRTLLVKKLKIAKLEAIIRGYITGSGWKEYGRAGTVCSIKLPEGLQNCQKLPETIFTPSTKADQGEHDENISVEKAQEIIGKELCDKIKEKALLLFTSAEEFAREKGIIIADTKFEFGLDKNGTLCIADEVLTPDSSRFWSAEKYKVGQNQDSYDKQYVRDYLSSINFDKKTPATIPDDIVANTTKKYVEIFKIITGTEPKL